MYTAEHQAMATRFTLQIKCDNEADSKAVFYEAFNLLDQLELTLSRFVADSDISRINALREGQDTYIEDDTWNILKKAIGLSNLTDGAFDIGVGEYMNIFRGGKEGILNEKEVDEALKVAHKTKANASLYVDPDQPRVYCLKEGMKLDLGAIGKGHALEKLKDFLDELKINVFTIDAGDSTVLVGDSASEDKTWPYQLTSANNTKNIKLCNASISASGTYWQGAHIFDPRTGTNRLATYCDRVWVCAGDAAVADALSTAFFILSKEDIVKCIGQIPELQWVAYSKNGVIKMI